MSKLAKDWECLNRKALAFLRLASNPAHASKTLQSRIMSPDRLLGPLLLHWPAQCHSMLDTQSSYPQTAITALEAPKLAAARPN